jgi:hypothetical protein
MAQPGVFTPVIDLAITLPTKRKDGAALPSSDIASVTVMRNSVELATIPGPVASPVKYSDASPTSTTDTYSFYVTDSAGVRSDVSSAASVVVSNEPVKSPPAVGTLTAVVHGAKPATAGA